MLNRIFIKPYVIIAVTCIEFDEQRTDGKWLNEFSNLNLNHNRNCLNSNTSFVQSESKFANNIGTRFKLPFPNDTLEKRKFFQSTIATSSSKTLMPLNASSSTASSTLSLHITAYENSFKDFTGYLEEFKKKNSVLIQKRENVEQSFTGSITSIFQSPFEFPRQQKEDKVNDPGVMQFKSTQQLLNPSQTFRPPQSSATFRAPLDPSRTFRPPQSSRTFRPPQSSPTFRPPQSSPTFQNPQSSPTFRNPQSSPTFRKPESPFARYLPKNLLKEARKENEDLHVQIAKLKLENAEKDQTIAQLQLEQKTDQGRREKLQSQVKEMQKEAKNHRRREKRALIPKEVKSFSDYGKTQQKKIVQKYWENILQEYDEDSAKTLVQKVYKNYAKEEIPSLTALETLHIIKTSNLSYNSFKKIKHELQLHGSFPKIFASMHAVNQERQKIHKLYETECFTAKMKDTIEGQLKDVTVIVLKWIEQVLQQRLDDTCDAGNYVKLNHIYTAFN